MAHRRSPLFALFLTVFIDLLGFGLFLPSLAYMAYAFKASEAQIGMLQASFSIAQFLFAPMWGWLSDRIGRRPVMLMSIAGGGVSYLAFGLSRSLLMLFIARIASGIFAANIATAQAYVADVTTPENRAKGMGMIGAAFGLGFTLGPPIGGLLGGTAHGAHIAASQAAEFAHPALFAAGLCAVNLIMAAFVLPESRPAQLAPAHRKSRLQALLSALTVPQLAGLIMLFFVVTFAFGNMEQALVLSTFNLFKWGPRQNGELLGFVGILIVIMQGGLIGRLSKRFGEKRLLVAGAALMAVGLAMLGLGATTKDYWLAMIPLALGNGLANPSLASLISRAAPANERGSTMGVSQSASSLARIFAPIWAGWSFEHVLLHRPLYSHGAPFVTGAVVMAIGLIMAIALPAIVDAPGALGASHG